MKKLCFVFIILMIATTSYASASFVNHDNNSGYVFSKDNPNIKYYIKNVADFTTFIAYAAIHRNDYDQLTLIGDSSHIVGIYTHKYEVLAGDGKVHIYLYRLLDNDFGDELYLQMSEKQIEGIINILESKNTSKNINNKSLPSVQTVSTYSQMISNINANDMYGTMACLSRLVSEKYIKNLMLMYHPALNIKDTLNNGVNINNITNFYSNIRYITN